MTRRIKSLKTGDIPIGLIDDDPFARRAIEQAITAPFESKSFPSPELAEVHLPSLPLVFLDLNFPGIDGMQILKKWRAQYPEVEIIASSGEMRAERIIESLRLGASAFLSKPIRKDDVNRILDRFLKARRLREKADTLETLHRPAPVTCIAESKKMRKILREISQLKGETDLSILLLGESGTGKEIIARTLHQQEVLSRPFVVANMPAIPPSLMESELFGVERGAYTDAKKARAGKFEQADGGDIFLDEIGDLPIEMQAKLLRTLQEGTVDRVGSAHSRQIQFRVISATNQPLGEMIENKSFRADLAYRLNDITFWLPPLRERPEDIVPLARFFLERYKKGDQAPRLSARAEQQLLNHEWPGNIRQLESAIKRTLIFQSGKTLRDISLEEIGPPCELPPKSYLLQVECFERGLIQESLARHGGSRTAAMKELDLPRATFYRKMSELRIGGK